MAENKLKITSIDDALTDGVEEMLNLTEQVVKKPSKVSNIEPVRPNQTIQALPTDKSDVSHETPSFTWTRLFVVASLIIWLVVVAGLLFSVLKVGDNWQTYTPLQWVAIITLVLGPALLILLTGYTLKQLARLSQQSYALSKAAHLLTTPDQTVIGKSQIMAEAVAAQIDQVNEKLNAAIGRLTAMDEVVAKQTASFNTSNQQSRDTIEKINASVEMQDATISKMTDSLDKSMVSLSNNLTMHTDNLAKSVQIAEQKIKEARISVEGATAKINSASDIVRSNTVQATSTLSASHQDIKSLGDIIRLRSDELDQVYKKHANELTAMIEHLRDEQTSLGASMEERLVKMRDLSLSAQASAESLSHASNSGKETIEALAAAASLADGAVKTRFDEMRDMVQYSTEHAHSISDMAASRVQDSLELTRKEITRIEQEMAGLQARIGNKKPRRALELIPEEELEQATRQPNNQPTSSKKKWTRLKLKSVIDIRPEIALDADSEMLIQTPDVDVTSDQFKPVTDKIKPDMSEPLVLGDVLIEPDTIRQSTESLDEIEPSGGPISPKTNALQEHINHPHIDSNKKPASSKKPDTTKNEESISRPAPLADGKRQKPAKTNEKRGLFGGLFGGRSNNQPSSSLDIASSKTPKPLSSSPPPTDDELILADLAQLGLSANAIVDEGCIIEATNVRVSSGHKAMSHTVAERLKTPVEHLVKTIAVDDELSDKAIVFATRFDRTIEMLSGNRESIRMRLESEKGRAYLLCDAALNYGRE